jgi:hypothetical protein
LPSKCKAQSSRFHIELRKPEPVSPLDIEPGALALAELWSYSLAPSKQLAGEREEGLARCVGDIILAFSWQRTLGSKNFIALPSFFLMMTQYY